MVEPHAADHGTDICQLVLVLQLLRATVCYCSKESSQTTSGEFADT